MSLGEYLKAVTSLIVVGRRNDAGSFISASLRPFYKPGFVLVVLDLIPPLLYNLKMKMKGERKSMNVRSSQEFEYFE